MFQSAEAFNQPLDGWDVALCLNMVMMFSGATRFNQTMPSWDGKGLVYRVVNNLIYVFAE